MVILGITGGSGTGKSTLAKTLKVFGMETLDCDKIYHEMLLDCSEMIEEIGTRFNNVSVNGVIDRQRLGGIVWRDPNALNDLNNITHKHVNIEIDKRINELSEQGNDFISIDAIALIESGQSKKCDFIIGVIASVEKRIARIIERDKLTRKHAKMRVYAQKPDSFYRLNCNCIIENNFKTLEEFEREGYDFFWNLDIDALPELIKEEINP